MLGAFFATKMDRAEKMATVRQIGAAVISEISG